EAERHRSLEKAARQLAKNVNCYVQYTQNVKDMENIIKDHTNGSSHKNGNDPYKHFKDKTEQLVLAPLTSLQGMFTAPQKLIQKRYDKLLDYCCHLERSSSFSSSSSTSSPASDTPPGPAKRDYEAINALLVEELQWFNKAAYTILTNCVPEVQHQTEEQRDWLLAEYPLNRLYQLKRKCNGCQEQDLSLLEGELVALLEDTDPSGSSSRWLVHTGG
ncbi:hypothetical protein XENOCAPTIV_002507, partial [Xenoophorus captivus]